MRTETGKEEKGEGREKGEEKRQVQGEGGRWVRYVGSKKRRNEIIPGPGY